MRVPAMAAAFNGCGQVYEIKIQQLIINFTMCVVYSILNLPWSFALSVALFYPRPSCM